jgi:transmembrane sensor
MSYRWIATAAAVAIALVGGWFMLTRWPDTAFQSHELITGVGQVRTVNLEDGSQIILGGATTLRTSFSPSSRQIYMTGGEASFRVGKDATRPFTVVTAEGFARAVGTAFDVRRGPEGTTVTVVEGVVEVSPPNGDKSRSRLLHPGERVLLPAVR